LSPPPMVVFSVVRTASSYYPLLVTRRGPRDISILFFPIGGFTPNVMGLDPPPLPHLPPHWPSELLTAPSSVGFGFIVQFA